MAKSKKRENTKGIYADIPTVLHDAFHSEVSVSA